jgi:hypothetical protein
MKCLFVESLSDRETPETCYTALWRLQNLTTPTLPPLVKLKSGKPLLVLLCYNSGKRRYVEGGSFKSTQCTLPTSCPLLKCSSVNGNASLHRTIKRRINNLQQHTSKQSGDFNVSVMNDFANYPIGPVDCYKLIWP